MNTIISMYQPVKHYTPSNINKKEEIDVNALNYFILNKPLVDQYEDIITKGKLHTILKKYKKNFAHGYVYTEYEQKHPGIGRFYVKNTGLQFLKKEIRETLCHKHHKDIDMVNAYPQLLYNLCVKNSWKADILKSYIDNRESKLKEIIDIVGCTRDEAKQSINILINNGELHNKKFYNKDLWLQHFAQELFFIKDQIVTNYKEYANIAAKKEKKKENKVGSTMALLLSDLENQCILALDEFLTNKGYDVQVLIFDGLQISNKKEINDEDLREAEAYVLEKTEMDVKFAIKPFTNIIDIDYSTVPTDDEIIDDDYACSVFHSLISDYIISYQNEIIVYDEDTGIWCQDERILWRYVHKNKKALVFKSMTLLGEKTHDYGGNRNNIRNMLKFLPNYCQIDDNFWNDRIDSSKGKLLFQNGYYDFHTDKFTEGYDCNIVFKSKINRPYNPSPSKEDICKVHKSLFEDPFLDEERDTMSKYLKIAFARAIAGDYLYKVCYFIIGLKDSCKGVLYEAIKNCFEGYVSSFNGACLYYNKNSADEAKKLSWLQDICDTRIAFASEPRMEGNIDTTLLKTLSSGGDPITSRKNFKDEGEIKNRATVFTACNDLPGLQPVDEAILGRLNCIELKCRFLPPHEITNTRFQRVANENIKMELKQNNYKDALMYIFADAYRTFVKEGHHIPDVVKEAKDDWVDNEFSLKSILNKEYKFTCDPEDYIIASDVNMYLQPHRQKIKMSDRKIALEITNITGLQSTTKMVTIDGEKKTVRVRKGMKLLD